MSDAERVTVKAELLRRNAGDNGPDTTLATGFAPTGAFGDGALEGAAAVPAGGRRADAWPWVALAAAGVLAALVWAIHAKLVHHPG